MNLLKKLAQNLRENVAEYHTLFCIVFAIPFVLAMLTSYKWGLLVSFMFQTVVGLFYIKGSTK